METVTGILDNYTQAAASCLREAAIISVIDIISSVGAFFVLGFLFIDTLGIILLVEGAGLMLIGGALGFAGQPGLRAVTRFWGTAFGRRSGQDGVSPGGKYDPEREREDFRLNDVRAAFYMLTGVVLFLESMALAFVV